MLGDAEGRPRVEELLQEQKDGVKGLLERNQHLVAALRDALLERHELVGHEITDVLEQAQAASRPGHRPARPVRDRCRPRGGRQRHWFAGLRLV